MFHGVQLMWRIFFLARYWLLQEQEDINKRNPEKNRFKGINIIIQLAFSIWEKKLHSEKTYIFNVHIGITTLTSRANREKKLIKLKAAKVRKAEKNLQKKWPWKKLISIFSIWEEREREWGEIKKNLSGKKMSTQQYVAVCSHQHVCCMPVHQLDALACTTFFFLLSSPISSRNEMGEKNLTKKNLMEKSVFRDALHD